MADKPVGVVIDRGNKGVGITPETSDHGTKSEFLKDPKHGQIPSFPGDFELQKLILESPHREGFIDLKAAWSDFNIYESIFQPYLTADIQIIDGVGLMESVPIIGEETLTIQVKTKGIVRDRQPQNNFPGPFEGSQNEGRISLKFRVVKINDITKLNDQMLTYRLSLVSEEAIINLKQKVRKTTLDPAENFEPSRISKVVKRLYKQFFVKGRAADAKKIFIEPTKNPTDLIIPNQSPFQAFNFLAGRAVAMASHAVGSSFVFYESIRGFFFISIETLMVGGGLGYQTPAAQGPPSMQTGIELDPEYTQLEDPVKETYVVQPKRLGAQSNEPKNVAVEMTSVDDYQFTSNFDVLKNLQNGMYANRLLTHDLIRMKYDTLDFNLVDKNALRQKVKMTGDGAEQVQEYLNQAFDAKNFKDGFTHVGPGKLATEKQDALGSPEAKMSFYPTNFAHDEIFKEAIGSAGVHGEPKDEARLNIIPNRVEQWMQSRLVQSQQMNNIKLNIRAPGLSTRTVGDLIEFKLPTQYLEDRDGFTQSSQHTYLSGYYLITKLRHHFTKEKYDIEFEAIKDSLNKAVGKDRSAEGSGHGTMVGKDTEEALAESGRMKGQSGR
tara:strand:+ start:844 stop:2667 length:1824 start_codon:yes stop_codon:yes gene_type:complete